MSRRAKVYWATVALAAALFVAMVVVGGLGIYRQDHALLHAMTVLLYLELAVVIAVMVIRGGPRKPHPR